MQRHKTWAVSKSDTAHPNFGLLPIQLYIIWGKNQGRIARDIRINPLQDHWNTRSIGSIQHDMSTNRRGELSLTDVHPNFAFGRPFGSGIGGIAGGFQSLIHSCPPSLPGNSLNIEHFGFIHHPRRSCFGCGENADMCDPHLMHRPFEKSGLQHP